MLYEKYPTLDSWHLSDKSALGVFHVLSFCNLGSVRFHICVYLLQTTESPSRFSQFSLKENTMFYYN